MSTLDLGNLRACIEDARKAAASTDAGPKDPLQYDDLIARLPAAIQKLPPLYRDTVGQPFLAKLQSLGASGFRQVLQRDPDRSWTAGAMLDIAQAILQNGEGYQPLATDGFQEVVSDLYDGFLSAEDRHSVKPPDRGVIAPLVKWGAPDFGPYTWPVDATTVFGVEAGIVNLPPANAKRGLLAWAALGHETAGHDILDADTGLRQELAFLLERALKKAKLPPGIPEYWSTRIDETASDVMGMLNMGPAAGVGIIAYFRALNAVFAGGATLRNEGPEDDTHPADIMRGFLAAAVVRKLEFTLASDWANAIEAETLRDVTGITLEDRPVTVPIARKMAEVVASTIMTTKLDTLEHHALCEIQNWHDHDETLVARLSTVLAADKKLPSSFPHGVYAAHMVAAGVVAGLAKGGKVAHVFERMLGSLKTMHNANPSWGPLFVVHRGDVTRRLTRVTVTIGTTPQAARPVSGKRPAAIAGVVVATPAATPVATKGGPKQPIVAREPVGNKNPRSAKPARPKR